MIYIKLDNHDVTRLKVTLKFDHLSFLGFEKNPSRYVAVK